MKYLINKKRILEILHKHNDTVEIDNDCIKDDCDNEMMLSNRMVECIKNKSFHEEDSSFSKCIIEILHPYFDEIFTELQPKVSLKKCVKFLEDLKFKVKKEEVNSYTVYTTCITDSYESKNDMPNSLNDIEDRLNGNEKRVLIGAAVGIYTLLDNNRDELLED